jgi:hypothetical protein
MHESITANMSEIALQMTKQNLRSISIAAMQPIMTGINPNYSV